MLIAAFSLFTVSVVLFDPPPLCDHLCPLLALAPILTCTMWSIWLTAWHAPNWQRTTRFKRSSVAAIAVAALGQQVWFWNQ